MQGCPQPGHGFRSLDPKANAPAMSHHASSRAGDENVEFGVTIKHVNTEILFVTIYT